ncbi:MAG: DUF72 domain-containing protein [Pirellula sp.]
MGKSTSSKVVNPTHNPQWDRWSYRIGCPVWACRHWQGQVYPDGTRADDFLRWYSHAFPTVEGNSTFYALPPVSTVEKWIESAAATFQFCFKFPRKISHDSKLVHCGKELELWLDRLALLRESGHLGPTFLQLAPSFSFAHFAQLSSFLKQLPSDWPWAVEVRHRDWFDTGDCEAKLDELLRELCIDRVLFDSRPLNSESATDSAEQASQSRKPKSPFRTTVTGKRPMVRLIGRNNAAEVTEYWEEWAAQIANWIRQGYQPWIFTHAPDDTYAPGLARLLHEFVRLELPQLSQLPNLVAERGQVPADTPLRQMDLF